MQRLLRLPKGIMDNASGWILFNFIYRSSVANIIVLFTLQILMTRFLMILITCQAKKIGVLLTRSTTPQPSQVLHLRPFFSPEP